jgi:hypothetical protein
MSFKQYADHRTGDIEFFEIQEQMAGQTFDKTRASSLFSLPNLDRQQR